MSSFFILENNCAKILIKPKLPGSDWFCPTHSPKPKELAGTYCICLNVDMT